MVWLVWTLMGAAAILAVIGVIALMRGEAWFMFSRTDAAMWLAISLAVLIAAPRLPVLFADRTAIAVSAQERKDTDSLRRYLESHSDSWAAASIRRVTVSSSHVNVNTSLLPHEASAATAIYQALLGRGYTVIEIRAIDGSLIIRKEFPSGVGAATP